MDEEMKLKKFHVIHKSLVFKLILCVGCTLLFSICTWAYFNIQYQKKKLMAEVVAGGARLTDTIKLGTQYAMMLNSRDDINQIIMNISKQKEIDSIRIYNKDGRITFSNKRSDLDRVTSVEDEACHVCHRSDPPPATLSLNERTRILDAKDGHRMLAIISPIANMTACSAGPCHFHPSDKEILGALDVVLSLKDTDKEILFLEKGVIGLGMFVFLLTSLIISFFVIHFIIQPVKKLIEGTNRIAEGDYLNAVQIHQQDEMGELAGAVNRMGRKIEEKQAELNQQRDEYQTLFEQVPCFITVQGRDYRLQKYNREFLKRFDPKPGDLCYSVYKGRKERCENCAVEKTFADGLTHSAEETGVNKDGTMTHWLVQSSPIRDKDGKIVAAMEMSLDITHRKELENKLEESEKKYYAIFNNIPNPVFVLNRETLEILDCNESVHIVYGYDKEDVIRRSFLDLFKDSQKEIYRQDLQNSQVINQVQHVKKDGKSIYVNIRVSPSEYSGQKVLLATSSDITQRLEAEQQLIQASKMATLGEMATGVAHELNQPLSVIKTASRFFMKKISKREKLEEGVLFSMLGKVDSNVDRAAKIIGHMRQFARKSDMDLQKVQINHVLESAFEIFSQQLKVRGVETVWEIESDLPLIKGDPGRLEQVFINLLLNARDAIEDLEKKRLKDGTSREKKIVIRSMLRERRVVVEVEDSGAGIPADIREKIFEPFFTTKEVGKGTGLGLSISYGIIKECGGEITVQSEEGRWTRFSLSFPVFETGGNGSYDGCP